MSRHGTELAGTGWRGNGGNKFQGLTSLNTTYLRSRAGDRSRWKRHARESSRVRAHNWNASVGRSKSENPGKKQRWKLARGEISNGYTGARNVAVCKEPKLSGELYLIISYIAVFYKITPGIKVTGTVIAGNAWLREHRRSGTSRAWITDI